MNDNMNNPQYGGDESSPRLFEQLGQIAVDNPVPNSNRGRGRGQRGYGQGRGNRYRPFGDDNRQHISNQSSTQAWNNFSNNGQSNVDVFPPLGPVQPQTQYSSYQSGGQHQQQQQRQGPNYAPRAYHTPQLDSHSPQYHVQQQPQRQYHQGYDQPAQMQIPSPDFRGRGRGGAYRGSQNYYRQIQQYQPDIHRQQNAVNTNDFSRPPANSQNRIFVPGMNPHAGTADQQRAFRHKIMSQSDYLASIASHSLKNQLTPEEAQSKEAFRKKLQVMAQQAIADSGGPEVETVVQNVKLRLYGSLGSGFAIAGSDMDLLLTFPQNDGPLREVEIMSRRNLEKAILYAGHGARLLTNTRVPILKVCELPSPALLKNLREYREKWEANEDEHNENSTVATSNGFLPSLSDDQMSVATEALSMLDMTAAEVPLPASPTLDHAKLDFEGDCGIQCDINFSNYVALANTELLKIYGQCDGRVRQIGIFVKNWAKARDINTPYRGTLSSYGYIMMVLHYLMNIVNPPLIPNLQKIAKDEDTASGNTVIDTVEGCDIRFVRNSERVHAIMQGMPKNHESLGSLLRGFFWYYAVPQGFHYNRDAISIRTKGGCVTKRAKGWTEAKWSDGHAHVRLRYLLAIEDPFEIDHNIGRTVGHHGIVAIRDEFRRAWTMIDTVHLDSTKSQWYWDNKGERQSAEDFMSAADNRGDLLRQDQNFHKDKIRRMRQEVEAKEQALKQEMLDGDVSTEESKTHGTLTKTNSECPLDIDILNKSDLPGAQLIQNRSFQEKNGEWKSRMGRRRRLTKDDENDAEEIVVSTEVVSPVETKENGEVFHASKISQVQEVNQEWETSQGWEAGPASKISQVQEVNQEWETSQGWDATQGWETQIDSQAYMTSEKDTWGATIEDENGIVNDLPKINTAKNFNWEDEPMVENATAGSQWYGTDTASDVLTSDNVTQEVSDHESRVDSYDVSDFKNDKSENVNASADDAIHHSEESDLLDSSEEIIRQRQDHIAILGNRAFARTKKAVTELEPHNRTLSANRKVGSRIYWDEHSKAGRWLRWRDRQIKADKAWAEPRLSQYRALNKRFPYNPQMTYADLEVMNAELREHYRDTLVPSSEYDSTLLRDTKEQCAFTEQSPATWVQENGEFAEQQIEEIPQHVPDESSAPVDTLQEQRGSKESLNPDLKIQPLVQPEELPDKDSINPETSSNFTLEQLRERRLMYYAQKESKINAENNVLTVQNSSTVQRKDDLPLHQSSDRRRDSGFSSIPAKQDEPRISAHEPDDTSEPDQSIINHQQKLLSLLNMSSSKTDNPQPNNQHPRDADSNVTPIPRMLGFVFDPRQIEDLHKIKLGGNGCARRGEEFNVEEDYEWGGGGAMGYKSSSGAFRSGPGGIRRASSWHGKRSDGMRLLDELPGFV